jgi:hypothetical protein
VAYRRDRGDVTRGKQWPEFSTKSWRIPTWQRSLRELPCSLPQPSSAKPCVAMQQFVQQRKGKACHRDAQCCRSLLEYANNARRRRRQVSPKPGISRHFERGPLQYASETDWLAGAAGFEPVHQNRAADPTSFRIEMRKFDPLAFPREVLHALHGM